MKYKNITKGRGDTGYTDLCLGGSVMKDDRRIEAVGDIDEFHATLGLCQSVLRQSDAHTILKIQKCLTNLMGEIPCADNNKELYIKRFGGINKDDITFLDSYKDVLAEELDNKHGGQSTWSLYGEKGEASAKLDYSGTVCRRCERRIVHLQNFQYSIRNEIIVYLNRLSKVLYLLARNYET